MVTLDTLSTLLHECPSYTRIIIEPYLQVLCTYLRSSDFDLVSRAARNVVAVVPIIKREVLLDHILLRHVEDLLDTVVLFLDCSDKNPILEQK